MAKTDKEMLDNYKARIKRQNNAIRENYDRISATLPKGTIDRIKSLGLTVNGVVNECVLAYLEEAETLMSQDTDCAKRALENDQNAQISPETDKGEEFTTREENGENRVNTKPIPEMTPEEVSALIAAKRKELGK